MRLLCRIDPQTADCIEACSPEEVHRLVEELSREHGRATLGPEHFQGLKDALRGVMLDPVKSKSPTGRIARRLYSALPGQKRCCISDGPRPFNVRIERDEDIRLEFRDDYLHVLQHRTSLTGLSISRSEVSAFAALPLHLCEEIVLCDQYLGLSNPGGTRHVDKIRATVAFFDRAIQDVSNARPCRFTIVTAWNDRDDPLPGLRSAPSWASIEQRVSIRRIMRGANPRGIHDRYAFFRIDGYCDEFALQFHSGFDHIDGTSDTVRNCKISLEVGNADSLLSPFMACSTPAP